eukprot:scaffold7729_cov471-Prasinococcus_capsulatus_cf.AAC.1
MGPTPRRRRKRTLPPSARAGLRCEPRARTAAAAAAGARRAPPHAGPSSASACALAPASGLVLPPCRPSRHASTRRGPEPGMVAGLHADCARHTLTAASAAVRCVLRAWFSAGCVLYTAIVACAAAYTVLVGAAYGLGTRAGESVQGTPPSSSSEGRAATQVLLPGWTVPWADICHVYVALLVSLMWHELGHALAAAAEGVPLMHFAIHCLGPFPGAHCGLCKYDAGCSEGGCVCRLADAAPCEPCRDSLERLRPLPKLRVMAAGIYHNLVLPVYVREARRSGRAC